MNLQACSTKGGMEVWEGGEKWVMEEKGCCLSLIMLFSNRDSSACTVPEVCCFPFNSFQFNFNKWGLCDFLYSCTVEFASKPAISDDTLPKILTRNEWDADRKQTVKFSLDWNMESCMPELNHRGWLYHALVLHALNYRGWLYQHWLAATAAAAFQHFRQELFLSFSWWCQDWNRFLPQMCSEPRASVEISDCRYSTSLNIAQLLLKADGQESDLLASLLVFLKVVTNSKYFIGT